MIGRLRRVRFTRQMLALLVAMIGALVVLGFVLVAVLMRDSLDRQYEQRALSVARAVAADPQLGDLVRDDRQPQVQAIALRAQRATGALFVVVTNADGIRLAHPDPAQIGKRVSTDPSAALSGREVANIEQGTLGLSARGKVPLRDGSGRIVGEVSVGFDAREISRAEHRLLAGAVPFALGALALGLAGAMLLTRVLKRATFGLEPGELADLVREREAVLHGLSEGLVAVDGDAVVRICTAEAARLLEVPVRLGVPVADAGLPDTLAAALASGREERDLMIVTGHRVVIANLCAVHRDGRDLGLVATLRDRTDVERLSSELDAVRGMTSALRAQRHEFANQLHTIGGLLEADEPEDAMEYLRAITGSAGVGVISDSPAVRSSTLRAFLAAKRSEATAVGVQLDLSDVSWAPTRLLAPVEVVTVLGNLIDNAVAAARRSARRPAAVEIDVLEEGAGLVVSVMNTGDGVPAADVDRIFAAGMSTHGPERGLGLAIARQTARSLGGDVELAHRGGDGQPTVFIARLPHVLAVGESSGVAR